MFRTRLLGLLAAIVLVAVAATPAQALVSIEGTGEPAFTNTTTNTVFVRYQGDGFTTYRLHFRYFVSGNASPFFDDFSGNLGNPASNFTFANWTGVINTLVEGSNYGICTQGETLDIANPLWLATSSNSTCDTIQNAAKRTNTDDTGSSLPLDQRTVAWSRRVAGDGTAGPITASRPSNILRQAACIRLRTRSAAM